MKHLFNKVFTIRRKIKTSDNQGGWTEDWQDVGLVKGRLRPASASERMVAAQEQARISHVFYCAAKEDIRRGDQLVDGNLTVEVIAIRNPSYADHHLECDGMVVQHG